MVVIKVEMWPLGRESHAFEIGRAFIANVGGSMARGDYQIAVNRRGTQATPPEMLGTGPKALRTGAVKNYPRQSYNMWRLVIRALLDAFPEERTGIPIHDPEPMPEQYPGCTCHDPGFDESIDPKCPRHGEPAPRMRDRDDLND